MKTKKRIIHRLSKVASLPISYKKMGEMIGVSEATVFRAFRKYGLFKYKVKGMYKGLPHWTGMNQSRKRISVNWDNYKDNNILTKKEIALIEKVNYCTVIKYTKKDKGEIK
jgi:hypothetical protein